VTGNVIINELANLPHHDGQIVLHAVRDDFEVQIRYEAWQRDGCYWVHAYVRRDAQRQYTRLAAERSNVQQARDLSCSGVGGRQEL
jgi:hypothetical protein